MYDVSIIIFFRINYFPKFVIINDCFKITIMIGDIMMLNI